jgi:hypothetical protein
MKYSVIVLVLIPMVVFAQAPGVIQGPGNPKVHEFVQCITCYGKDSSKLTCIGDHGSFVGTHSLAEFSQQFKMTKKIEVPEGGFLYHFDRARKSNPFSNNLNPIQNPNPMKK